MNAEFWSDINFMNKANLQATLVLDSLFSTCPNFIWINLRLWAYNEVHWSCFWPCSELPSRWLARFAFPERRPKFKFEEIVLIGQNKVKGCYVWLSEKATALPRKLIYIKITISGFNSCRVIHWPEEYKHRNKSNQQTCNKLNNWVREAMNRVLFNCWPTIGNSLILSTSHVLKPCAFIKYWSTLQIQINITRAFESLCFEEKKPGGKYNKRGMNQKWRETKNTSIHARQLNIYLAYMIHHMK